MPRAPVQVIANPHLMLSATTVHLAIAEVGSLAGERILDRWSTKEDEESAQRPDRLLARALLRSVLAHSTALPSYSWRIAKRTDGRPTAVSADGALSPSVSISHTGMWSACAVAYGAEIGIDIERMRGDRDLLGIASRAFGPSECAEVATAGRARFYAIWTLREAIAKAVGSGLAMAADGKDRVAGLAAAELRAVTIDSEPWHVVQRELAVDLSFALAIRGQFAATPRLRWWSGGPEEGAQTTFSV